VAGKSTFIKTDNTWLVSVEIPSDDPDLVTLLNVTGSELGKVMRKESFSLTVSLKVMLIAIPIF
jgi:hypothetical protein